MLARLEAEGNDKLVALDGGNVGEAFPRICRDVGGAFHDAPIEIGGPSELNLPERHTLDRQRRPLAGDIKLDVGEAGS